MSVSSYPQLMLPLLLLICSLIGQVEVNADRQRRQGVGANNLNTGFQPGNLNGLMAPNNVQYNPSNNPNIGVSNDRNNQQQSNNNLLPSSQGQVQPVRSRGFYSSPEFKPPSFSGEKPVGWFDTKYQNWVSNQNDQFDKNYAADGKNAPPSSLQGRTMQAQREDGGAFFLEKVAQQYVRNGEKSFNIGKFNIQKGRGSVCVNRHNYDGYTFGKFPCPLPASTGMNQLDQFCCGIANYQYCCNEQEFNRNQGGVFGDDVNLGKNRHSKHSHYGPSTNRTLAIVLPVIGVLVVAGAVVIVFLYYKKLRNTQSKDAKPSGATRLNDNYSAVPQDPPVEKPIVAKRQQQNTTVQA